ncbi:hypothetical protein [Paracoccus marcusii]|uniref:Sialate O-acetylesterase domain-containing protein n=1 Tax=Paracoccus marcusii TaxID=59779 RepID=A0ABY7UP09_9RHOB|nr:hypothetical protein [Paracoccus marcusii]WDA11399.1 hypothetical protein PRL19_08705 [Paracoccus marcusii]
MPVLDTINRAFRDFVRFTGDGKPNAPVGAPLPIGDPRSGRHNPALAEIRAALIEVAQTQGDPEALQEIIGGLSTTTARYVQPIAAVSGGSGAAYTVTSDRIPINGQTFTWTPHVDSTVDNPTISISDGTTTATNALFSIDGGPVRLKGGAPYLVRKGAGVNYVLTQTHYGERRMSPIAPIRAASAVSGPSVFGSLQPVPVAGPEPYQIQPYHQRGAFQIQGVNGVIDCSNMIPGTQAEIYMRSGDRVVAGAGRSYIGRAGGTATATGVSVVRVSAMFADLYIEEIAGPAPTYTATIGAHLPIDRMLVMGGQSNANLFFRNGGIGGFSWGLRNWLQTPARTSVQWVNGATGGSALDRRSVNAGSENYWWDAIAGAPGPCMTTFTDAADAAVAAGGPAPSFVIWSQGEADAGAIQVGLLTTAQMTSTIRAVWGYIRARYPGIRILACPLGSHDDRNPDRGANAVRVAYLRAIEAESWAFHGAEFYDLQRPEDDIHYLGQSYAVLGARLARIWANVALGQTNSLGPRVTSSVVGAGGRSVNLLVDWGGAAFTPTMARVNGATPFGIYALAPGADPVTAPIPLMSVEVSGGVIRIASTFDLTGHQIGGVWGYMADARMGHIIRDTQLDPYHLMPGQPLRSFLQQL